MATSGVIDTYDTPMGEYDISMQSAPPDALWYTAETVMADGDESRIQAHSSAYESVEVEMHENENEGLEYDMLDNEAYAPEAADIELQDAMTLPETSMFTEGNTDASFLHPSSEEAMATQDTTSTVPATVTSEQPAPPVTHDDASYSAPPALSTTVEVADVSFELQEQNSLPQDVERPADAAAQPSTGPESTGEDAIPVPHPVLEEQKTAYLGVASPRVDEPDTRNTFTPSLGGPVIAAPDVPDPLSTTSEQQTHVGDDANHTNDEAVVQNHEPQEVDTANDGDDPPYPVDMVFRSAGQDQLWHLFTHDDGTDDPSATTNEPLLLRDRIDLFHRPLSDFFSHLRELDFVQRDTEFHRGELLLDAYDLDLSIAEDNVFARQVAFRDLTILHKGFPLSGPLCIRISFNLNSFRTRYTDLSTRAAAQEVDETLDGAHQQAPGTNVGLDDGTQSGEQVYDTANAQDEPDIDDGQDTTADGEPGHDTATLDDYPQGGELPDPELQHDTAQQEALSGAGEDDGYHQVATAEAGALEGENEYEETAAPFVGERGADGDEGDGDEGAGGELDAERVHDYSGDAPATGEGDDDDDETRPADVGAGDAPEPGELATEYEEQEGYYEDDDERFGEDLPADAGGGQNDDIIGHDGDAKEQEIWEAAADKDIPTFTPAALAASSDSGSVKPTSAFGDAQQQSEKASEGKNEGDRTPTDHPYDDQDPDAASADNDEAEFDVSAEELQSWEVGEDGDYDDGTDTTAEDEINYEDPAYTHDEGEAGGEDEGAAAEDWHEEDDPETGEAAVAGVAEQPQDAADRDQEVASLESSVTLSSGTGSSKRVFDDLDDDVDDDGEPDNRTGSPSGIKRARVD